MNTELLRNKVEDVISTFTVALAEIADIELARTALENSSYVNTDRERRLNEREVILTQREKDIHTQQEYIEKKHADTQLALSKIALDRKELEGLAKERLELEEVRLQMDADKKRLEESKQKQENFLTERAAFEQERRLFAQEKLTTMELQKLLVLREQKIQIKEDRIGKIERLTQI